MPATLDALAERVAAHIGRAGDTTTISLARGHVDVVAAFVHAFVRGRGFIDGNPEEPFPDLQAVIVAATARLTTNPEQVASYSAADYAERPAVLEGWTIAEQGVLHRYRRRWT